MLFAIAFGQFEVFTANITLYKPFVNFTEVGFVTQNSTLQYYAVLNTSGQIAMSRFTGTKDN